MTKRHIGLCILFLSVLLNKAVAQIETPCVDADDCFDLYECVENVCRHKDLFPITIREIITILLLMFIAGPAHGLGAGSILTPILLIGMNYTAGKSTMIMYSLILGGSVGAFLNAFWRRNPKTGKPVIDYDMVMIIMPLVLLGVGIGVTIKLAAPQVAIILALIIIEINTIKKLLRKMRESTAQKPAAISTSMPLLAAPEVLKLEGAEQVEGMGNIELKDMNLDLKKEEARQEERTRQERKAKNEGSIELQSIINEDTRLFPLTKFIWIFGLLAWVITMTILRSGPLLGIDYCGPRYWLLFALQLFGCFVFFARNRRAVSARCEIKRMSGISSDADFLLKETILSEFAQVAVIAGGLAGFLGIGAGVIMTPYLIGYGCPPGVVGPTMAFGIVQSSFIAMVTSLMLSKNLNVIELVFFFAVAVCGSYVINRLISFFIGKYQKPFITLWIMIAITGSSLIIMPIYTVWKSIEDPAQMLQYRWICS